MRLRGEERGGGESRYPTMMRRKALGWLRPAAFLVVLAILAGFCVYAYRAQKDMVRRRAMETLDVVAFYKTQQLNLWYRQTMSNARRAAVLPALAREEASDSPWRSLEAATRTAIRDELEAFAKRHDFAAAGLVDGEGRWLGGSLTGEGYLACQHPLGGRHLAGAAPWLTTVHPSERGYLHMDLVVPLSPTTGSREVPAAVVLLIDPANTLFRITDGATVYSQTVETSLVQVENGVIRYVNGRMSEKDPVQTVGMLSHDSPSAIALRGDITQGEGLDRRGVPVIYATSYIPWLGWGLVTTVHQSEAYASMRITALLGWVLIFLSAFTAGIFLYRWWSRRHQVVVGELAALDLRYKNLLETAQEGIWAMDPRGRTTFINEHLSLLLGYSAEELNEMTLADALDGSNRDRAAEVIRPRAMRSRGSYELRYRTKSGEELWAIVSASSLYGIEGEYRGTLCLITDITKRRRNEDEKARLLGSLESSQATLKQLVKRLFATQESERKRLSHDLHDELAQLLVSAEMHLCAAENGLAGTNSEEVQDELTLTRKCLNQASMECRKLISRLRPPALDELGFTRSMRNLADGMSPLKVRFHMTDEDLLEDLPPEVTLTLYRITQEALNNAKKHAGVEAVAVRLSVERERVRLEIIDEGLGFRVDQAPPSLHFGLNGMRERAELIGAEFHIESKPGKGTRIAVEVSPAFSSDQRRISL